MTKRKVILALLPILVCLGAVSGWAYWTTIGSGTASASNGTLTAPSNVTVPSDSTGSVQVSWNGTIGPDNSAVTGYYVQRYGGTPSPANACGTDPLLSNTWIAAGSDPRSCDDLNLDDGTYTYKVTAVWRTWTAQSAPSGNVTVVVSAASTTTLTSSLNPSQVGDQVTYTATVSAAALGTPTGNVEFLDGGVAIVACGGATGTAVNGSGVATCDVTYNAAGSHTITAEYLGDASHSTSSSNTVTQVVDKADQTITFTSTAPSAAQVAGSTYTVTATGGNSGNPVTFSIDASASAVCSISGSTVSFTAAGTCKVNANQAGNSNYNAAPQVQQTFTVAKGDQTITFAALADRRLDQTPLALTASSSSGLAVSFSSATASVCTVAGNSVTLLQTGTCTINADQAGNANWNPAPQVTRSFTVLKGNQTISFSSTAPASAKVGGATYTPTATATSGLPVTMTIDATASSVCSISAGVVSFQSVGTCKVNANQPGNTNWNAAPQVQQTFTVAKGDQTITFGALANKTFDQGPITVSATASSALAVIFTSATTAVCTVSGSTVTFVTIGTCTINANQPGDANWNAATQVQQSFTISKGSQTISFTSTAPASAKVAGATYTPTATATSGLPVTMTIDATASSVCSISAGVVSFQTVGTCKINANQAGNTNWNAAPQVQQTFTVAKGDQTITFATIANRRLDESPFTLSATASSALAVTFTSNSTSICTVSGSTVTLIKTGNCILRANQAGNTDWNAAPQVQQNFTVTKGNQTITFGTAPAEARTGVASSVSATASSLLAVSYGSTTAPICTVNTSTGALALLTWGLCTISGDQPGDANDWNAAPQATQSFQVYNGTVAGLAFTSITVNNISQTPTCTGTIGTTYNCTVPGVANNATLNANIVFVNSSAAATIYSAVNQTINNAYVGKNLGTPTVTILANQSASSTKAQVDRSGNGQAQITVTFTRPGGGTWTAVLRTI